MYIYLHTYVHTNLNAKGMHKLTFTCSNIKVMPGTKPLSILTLSLLIMYGPPGDSGRPGGDVSLVKYLCWGCTVCKLNAKQKHLGCKKVRGQSEATFQTGRCDQKV